MTEGFVPLAARGSAGDAAEPFRVKVLTAANGTAVPFQPLAALSGGPSAQIAHANHAAPAQVTLVRDGDRITAIRVQCACGEVIELQCVY